MPAIPLPRVPQRKHQMGIVAFAYSTASSLVGNWLDAAIRGALRKGFPTSRSLYLRELHEQLKRMPFIYRDLELDVLQDAVTVELLRLNPSTLLDSDASYSERDTFERLRDSRKVLLVGQAGIGKTTLFRYCILSLIVKGGARFRLPKKDRPTPCYVPLKAVSPSEKNPIVAYLLAHNPLFRGSGGLARLISMAHERKIMLFLDGYDEIPIVAGTERIRDEIAALIARYPVSAPYGTDSQDSRWFYAAFVGCRIWLSSRREFLLANPVALPDDISVFWSQGVRGERVRLVTHIFSKYREHAPDFYSEKLDPERFLQQLAVAADGSLDDLSRNPLFLTVMCFVYVGDLRENRDPSQIWHQGAYELIHRCIDLLLIDIDFAKVRGLTEVQRHALLHRRAAYRDEKREFLEYVSVESYFANEPLQTERSLTERAMHFFSHESKDSTRHDILHGLSSDDATVNLVKQIIYSGVLVGVEYRHKQTLLDFPHRRFKEVLACRRLDNDLGLERLAESISQPYLAELIIVYVEQSSRAEELIKALINSLGTRDQSLRLGTLLLECLQRVSAQARIRVMRHLSHSILREHRGKALPLQLIDYWPQHGSDAKTLTEAVKTALENRDESLFAASAIPLHAIAPITLRELVVESLARTAVRDELTRSMATLVVDYYPDLTEALLLSAWPEKNFEAIDDRGIVMLAESVYARGGYSVRDETVKLMAAHFGNSSSQIEDLMSTRQRQVGVLKAEEPASERSGFIWAVEGPRVHSDAMARVAARKWSSLGFAPTTSRFQGGLS